MEDMSKTLPQYTLTLYNDYWNFQDLHNGAISAQQSFKARPSDVLLSSFPKTGTTWLKALAFAIVTREKFDESTSPLLTTLPHECVPLLEQDLTQIEHNQKNSNFPLLATHLPYSLLPESVVISNCKIVYIYRNIKDVIVSYYHMLRNIPNVMPKEVPFQQVFDEFYKGKSWCGPFWDHILGYWKASQFGKNILFLKYEDMKTDPTSNVKRLAEFIGYPFSTEEEKAGVVENIIKLCSFESLSNLEVNKTGKHRQETDNAVENRVYFRKAKVGDWENHFTDEMKEKIDKLIDEKLSGTGLVLK